MSVHYVERAVQIYPMLDEKVQRMLATIDMERFRPIRSCDVCSQAATYRIPEGLVCGEHAWQAAAGIDWEVGVPWVPIRIDHSNA